MDRKRKFLLAAILLIAAVVRFFNFGEVPFTHDEFSAIFRTGYESFSELIDKGVMVDFHPAGIQLLINYWTAWFGYEEWVVKLPFAFFGLAAVYYSFKIGQRWFGGTAGFIVASFLATLAFPVMYSQIARPYISGLFFTLAMVFYWDKIVFPQGKIQYKTRAAYILFAALCAYNHHFSFLMAIIVGLTGFLFLKKKQLKTYIATAMAVFVLYLPHIPIFLFQISKGGVGGEGGWLGKPDQDFFGNYLSFIFHFSWFVGLLALMIFVGGIFMSFRTKHIQKPYLAISLAWGIILPLIGYFYSVFVNPVLQYSILIFSFPFILFFLFGFMPKQNFKKEVLLTAIITVITVSSLVYERKYYDVFYKSAFREILVETGSLQRIQPKTVSIIGSHKEITEYYIDDLHLNGEFVMLDDFESKASFVNFIKDQKAGTLSFGALTNIDPVYLSIMADHYPYLLERKDYYQGGFYVLSRKTGKENDLYRSFISCLDFESKQGEWGYINEQNVVDSVSASGNMSYAISPENEWGPGFEADLKTMVGHKDDLLDISVNIKLLDSISDVALVYSLHDGDQLVDWRAINIGEYKPVNSNGWFKAYFTVRLSDIDHDIDEMSCRIHIWNHKHTSFLIDDFCVKVQKGNPIIYGLQREI